MRCPRCGTINGKTNKFCRECGRRLDVLAQPAPSRARKSAAPDELALGGDLFEVWKLYEAGSLDEALEKVLKAVESFPGSASAHSLLALIYERKAELAVDDEPETARGFLKLAVEQYERIIDLNPDSAADRQKLSSLRMKLTGGQTPRPGLAPAGLVAALKAVPPQYIAAAVTALVVLMIAIAMVPGGEKGRARAKSKSSRGGSQQVRVVSTPNSPSEGAGAQGSGGYSGLKVYTFPASPKPATPAPNRSGTAPSVNAPPERVPPAKLPSIPELTIAPEPKKGAKEPKAGAGAKVSVTPEGTPPAKESPARTTGSDLFARAIELQNQGRIGEAIDAAQRAIDLYQADIDAGRDITGARRGVENAKKSIKIWQQSAPGGPE